MMRVGKDFRMNLRTVRHLHPAIRESLSMKIAVFTACMPEYTIEEAAEALASWGFEGVEWRVTKPPAPGEPVVSCWQGNRATVDPETIVENSPQLRELCRKSKLAMPVLGSYLHYKDLDLCERVMEAGGMLGTKAVRVGVDPYSGKQRYNRLLTASQKGYEKIIRLGEKYSVKPLIEMHHGNIVPSASAARAFAEPFAPPEMGFIHDAGNMVCEGYEQWKMGLEILGKYLAHIHVKNMSWAIRECGPHDDLRWGPAPDTLRRGQVSWEDVLDALARTGYRGWLSIEDFGPGETETKLRDDLNYLRTLLRARQAATKKSKKA